MDYHNLSLVKSITTDALINSMPDVIITNGCISVFGDTVGKPGDIIYTLKCIDLVQEGLRFKFGCTTEIIVSEPLDIVINQKVLGIRNCSKITWSIRENSFSYTRNINNEIETKVLKGQHNFNLRPNTEAFLFSTW